MKNALKYYYDLNVYDIHQIDGNYRFTIDKNIYMLFHYTKEIDLKTIYELNQYLLNVGFKIHQIILNNYNDIVTMINKEKYVLLQIRNDYKEKIVLNDILTFSNYKIDFDTNLKRQNWYNLWTKKIDYFEYQMNQIGKKYPLLVSSFSYFVGMAETSIELLNEIGPKEKLNYVVSHEKIDNKYTLFDLYNPLNFIVDLKTRDVSEFFKKRFFINEDILDEINYYLKYNNLSEYEIKMFFVRMIYPSFYFDLYEKILSNDIEEKEIIKITSKADNYEMFLSKLYLYLNNYTNLPNIEWIKKS